MIKTLYPTFQHWSEKGGVFIISDPHFDDADMNWRLDIIKKLTGRNDADEKFIPIYVCREINRICGKNDTLIILGDIGDESWLKNIKANYKILVKGNHDRGNSVYEPYFNEIYDGPLFIAKNIVLSHETMPPGPYFNIHGHEHYDRSKEWLDMLAGIKVEDCYLNTCCELNAFHPMNLKEIIKDKALGKYPDIHRVTIDEATERRKNEKN